MPIQGGATELLRALMGQHGSEYIADTADHTNSPGWFMIHFTEDTVIADLDDALSADDTVYATNTFKYGTTIFGQFTKIDLTSGACIAYEGPGF